VRHIEQRCRAKPGRLLARIAFALALIASASAQADTEAAAFTERQQALIEAFASRDAARVAAYFANDAVLHIANMPPVQGRTSIESFFGNVYRFMAASQYAVEASSIAGSADLAYVRGSVTNVFRGQEGSISYAGKFLLVWERRDWEWSVVVYAISNNQPEPAGR
jgi:ketosteroid isomerase-like protein